MQQPIDIILLSYNRLKYLFRTIQAIVLRTDHPYRITVVDNASTDIEVREYLQEIKSEGIIYQYLVLPQNIWHRGWDRGILYTRSDPFVISDPDIIVPKVKPCWLTQMLQCYSENPEYARLGLLLHVTNDPNNPDKRDIRKYDVRPKAGKNNKITDTWLDTTMQVIDRQALMRTRGFIAKEPGPPLNDLKSMGYKCGLYNRIAGVHLGWNEYKDYPDYLRYKQRNTNWMHYGEERFITTT